LRCSPFSWSLCPTCLRAPARRHLRGLVLDQDCHVHEEWLLGHAARSAHGCEHAPWPDLPIYCRRWSGTRCTLSRRVGPKVISDRVKGGLQPESGACLWKAFPRSGSAAPNDRSAKAASFVQINIRAWPWNRFQRLRSIRVPGYGSAARAFGFHLYGKIADQVCYGSSCRRDRPSEITSTTQLH
jgi:hypothetical protein